MLFNTLNSTYELDRAGRRMRYVNGSFGPLGCFAPAGEWKALHNIGEVEIGASVILRLEDADICRLTRVTWIEDEYQELSDSPHGLPGLDAEPAGQRA